MKYFNLVKKYRFDIIWISATLSIMLLINIAYMYSRDKTLNTVEKTDFKVFTSLMYNTSLNAKKFSNIANAFTIKSHASEIKARQALFHIALVTPKSCVENGKHPIRNQPFLCDLFPNPDAIEEVLKKIKTTVDIKGKVYTRIEYSTKELGIDDPRNNAYLIRKRKNINKWIIAKKRFYNRDSFWKGFSFFITKRYIQTSSFSSKFHYTRHSIYLILLTSFLLWLLFKSRERKNTNKYKSLMEESNRIKSEIVEKDSEYNMLKNQIYMIEEEVRSDEVKLTSNTTDNQQGKKTILERIRKKTIQQTQLNEALNKLRDEIINLEARGEAIFDMLDEKRVKLNSDQRNVEYRKLTYETKALKQLWRHEPTWTRRQQIETKVSLAKDNLPFTVTQAFIAFERHIDNEIEKCFDGQEQEEALDKTLIKKIGIISKHHNMSRSEQNLYHEIRKARNKWVHGAIYPNRELLEKLLSTLEKTDVAPAL
jgi:hypothetical protein